MKKQIYIIEHLESRVWRWCIIEYKHISKIVGKNHLWFTNIKRGSKELEKYGKVFRNSVSKMNLHNACVLDPEAKAFLTPKNSSPISYFIFGGILGDHPPKKRTKIELTSKLNNPKAFNIGKKQFSTDNAVFVVHEIASGKNFSDSKFKDGIEVSLNNIETVDFPFRYVIANGKPLISSELITYLKRKQNL